MLSTQTITSKIRQNHCYICDFFYGMINSNPYTIKSSKPLKDFVAEIDSDYKTYRQQDVEEFVQYILNNCSIIDGLTKFCLHTTYQCRVCGTLTIDSNSYLTFAFCYQNVNTMTNKWQLKITFCPFSFSFQYF